MFTLKKYCLGAALAWASLGLPGCSLAPEFNRPEPPVPAVLTADPARPPGPDWPAVPDWRDFFPEPRLKEYLALALAHNRDLKMAGLRVLEARARYGV
ncbi:MAG: multidrug transporter, partial [Candidatus Adiutrix sp.]|nr:multidrug transporter [Candidatus Adiutrix sp.]